MSNLSSSGGSMFHLLTCQRGNISVALLLAVIGIMSGLTMSSMAMRDVVTFQWDYEEVASLHFLRSEATRGQRILEMQGYVDGELMTPQRSIQVQSSNMKKTFLLQSKILNNAFTAVTDVSVGGNVATNQGFVIKSLINARRGFGQSAFATANTSIVRKYGEFYLRKQRYSEFMYFTDTDESTNGTPVYFYGPDVIHGRVHSNSDIWLKQAGGGSNQGWPTFYDLVSTSGHFQSIPAVIPYEDVFLGGWLEEYRKYEYPTEMNSIRANGLKVGPLNYDPKNIVWVVGAGTSYSMMLGVVSDPELELFKVFNPYPAVPLPEDPLFSNRVAMKDTTWTLASGGGVTNQSVFVNNKLWISGVFGSRQTWGTCDTMMLVGDITLVNTNSGEAPDSPTSMNHSDILGLVSEKSILIQYGYRDPVDSLRYHPNCGPDGTSGTPDQTGINIYAALCALGDGGGDPHKDGVFSFEYQHPHPSVPAIMAGTTLWDYIDLHRRRYPQTTTNPWPPNIDYPWYNPLWPERQPYLERGHINLWGSVAQRRRGFVHRNLLDSEYQTNGVWNIPIDACGGSSNVNIMDPVLNIPLNTRNYPGATGGGTGYKKNYHYDTRFYTMAPIDFPEVNLQGGDAPMRSDTWLLKRPPRSL